MIIDITGKILRDLRKKNEMALVDVEKHKIVSSSYLSQLENEQVDNASFKIIMQLLQLYKVDVHIDLKLPPPSTEIKEVVILHPKIKGTKIPMKEKINSIKKENRKIKVRRKVVK